MSVTIDIKGRYLNTSEDFEVQIEDQNPATVFDEIPGNKTINVEIPANDRNRAELRNPDRFEKMGSVDDRRFPGANLRHFGQIIHAGTLIIDETNKSYSGWIRGAVGNLSEDVAGSFINQSLLGGIKNFDNKVTYNPDSDDYACPRIFNRAFWYGRGKKTERQTDAVDMEGTEYLANEEDYALVFQHLDTYGFFVNYPNELGVATGAPSGPAVVCPMLFLSRVVELILSDHFIFVKENILRTDSNLKKLILYNNYNITKQGLLTVPKDVNLYDYWVNENKVVSANVIVASNWTASTLLFNDLIPKRSVGEFILGLQNYLNIVFSINDLNECRIVDRQLLLTSPAYDIDEFMVGEWALGTRKNVTVKLSMNHDDNDAGFSDNYEDLSDIRANIKEAVQQRADLDLLTPDMDEIRKVEAENVYYQFHWHTISVLRKDNSEEQEDILGWEKVSIGFQPYFHNDGKREVEEIETCFSTIQQSDNGYPIVQQPGNSDAFKTQRNEFSPRLLFYEGNEFASYHSSTMSLDWAGQFGLANTRWNYWLPFWANRLPATGVFKFPASVFYYIKNNKAILPLRTRHGSFIIDSIRAIAGKSDKITAELKVFKRESVVEYNEGTTPGSGGVTTPAFEATYVGVTALGKPYLVNGAGDVRIPPAWGPMSPTTFAANTCVDYDPVNKQLYVGGAYGTLYITDFSDIENIRMKSIKVFATGNVSSVRYLSGYPNCIMVGRDAKVKNEKVYMVPHWDDFDIYADGMGQEGTLSNAYAAKDFMYYDGYYYAVTNQGELLRATIPNSVWTELHDWDAHFTRLAQSDNYLWILEDDDRNFRAPKSTLVWQEWDLESNDEPAIVEAIHKAGDAIAVVTTDDYQGLWLVDPTQKNLFTPPLAKQCGGVCYNGASIAVAIQEASGATKIAVEGLFLTWNYINVPEFFKKLFIY